MPRPPIALPAPPRLLRPSDPAWPAAVRDLPAPPAELHVAGRSPPWKDPVAVVGTRRADDDALEFTHELAAGLAEAGCTVISGGALGVDGAAHEGALETGGCTVAVLATGLRSAYPPSHRALFERIAASGALVSEQEDLAAHRGLFLSRNRLIAALARRVVVVQAPYRSGALSTAAWARRLKRPVFSVPSAPWDVRGQGNLALLRSGAAVCTRARDVISVAALGPRPREEGSRPAENLSSLSGRTPDAQAVWAELGSRERHVDQLVRATALPVARVQRALVELVLAGLAQEGAPGRYRRPPSRSGSRRP